MVDWRLEVDLLGSTPNFFNKGPRYDGIIFKDELGRYQFGKLRLTFLSRVAQVDYPVALVELLDVVHQGARSILDRELGLCRVRSKGKDAGPSRFIPAQWIVRGALITKDHGCEYDDEYFVIDVVDSDMFLRCKQYIPYWYS